MTKLRLLLTALAVAAWITTNAGCGLLHELQPHRLQRWNRQPPPPSSANFSVSDEVTQNSSVNDFMSSTQMNPLTVK